ncbi:MAG: O-antigen ligase family protein, partial [Muribaculaceae bacterium]|nr:O-antigen ligase family protein [Muribaculaceae bacterium]
MPDNVTTGSMTRHWLGLGMREAVMAMALLAGGAECVMGWVQLLGIAHSGHLLYPATGTFFNPGPYCAFLAIIIPVALACAMRSSNKVLTYGSMVYLVLAVGLMPVLIGRTGWIAAIAGGVVTYIGCKERRIRITLPQGIILTTLIIAGCIGLYFLKPASAMGRLLIWKTGLTAMLDKPLAGWGWDNVPGALGQIQQEYFAIHPDSTYAAVAGSPEYAFNEYLQVGIAFGMPAMLLFVAATIWIIRQAWRKKAYGYAGFFVAFAIVCLCSYPMQFNEFIILVSLMALPMLSRIRVKWLATAACLTVVGITTAAVSHTLRRNNAKKNWLGIRSAYI